MRAGRLACVSTLAAALCQGAWSSPAQDYMLYCQGCHGDQAQGVPGKVPPLAGSIALFMRSPEGRNYLLRVPGAANSALSDAQLAAVLNWLAERYPPAAGAPQEAQSAPFTAAEVAELRHAPLADVRERRREVVRALAASGPAPPAEY
jgi:mono/diheme cytochrome c family protein